LISEGDSHKLQTDGTTQTVRQNYAVAGLTIAMREGTTFSYFLTDHLGLRSVHTRAVSARGAEVGVADSSGTLVSESRYLPFGETRTDVGSVTQTLKSAEGRPTSATPSSVV